MLSLTHIVCIYYERKIRFLNQGGDGDRLCGLVVRVLGYRSGGPGSIPGTGTGSTQPREYN
jgi:hypothetical protein